MLPDTRRRHPRYALETSVPEPGPETPDPALEARLRRAVEGEVRFDRFTRGLYATDASHYQVLPLGVVFPRTVADVEAVMEVAREEGVPVLPRGGGTSQCGQTVGRAVVVDVSRHLTEIVEVAGGEGAGRPSASDAGGASGRGDATPASAPPTVTVQSGVILDHLNRRLRERGLWFPVDPSTGNRATLGGMAGNNSAGARSLHYGMMVDNVDAVEAVLPDGRRVWLGDKGDEAALIPDEREALRAIYRRDAEEIAARLPDTMREVAGYRLERLAPDVENLGRLLVGSEGTLAFFTRLRLRLSPVPRTRALGVCHFASLFDALDAVRHIVQLEPSAVELVDETVLTLAAGRPDFQASLRRFVRGRPGALLLVEFAEEAAGTDLSPRLDALEELLGELGFPDAVVRAREPALQEEVWAVRKAGLNIVMSMAGPRKPVSFVEDCAVPLEHLAEYAREVDAIFRRNDTEGTWYAHASVGCLHVRPALNLRDPQDVGSMRRIAGEVHEVVRRFGGTHSGEHGDGILRSEFLEPMLGRRMVEAFREVKRIFDPRGMMNPGKIVDPPAMDDRRLFRWPPDYAPRELPVLLDWSAEGGLAGAAERCNNNGTCRKTDPGVMCPSFRATADERHSTRGRANALRLALAGELGEDALESEEMAEAMSLCISCKGCKRECPAGVDMARMKLEWLHHRNRKLGVPLRERVLAALPRLAPFVRPVAPLVNLAGRLPALRALAARWPGIARDRTLPRWRWKAWSNAEAPIRGVPEVLLFVDTFSRWFEPENARAAVSLLEASGWKVAAARGPRHRRPLCCGRTWLSAGMLKEAKREATRLVEALAPPARAGTPIVGLEPSCLLTLRDEVPGLVPGDDARVVAEQAVLLEELLARGWADGRKPELRRAGSSFLVHGHCHQKAFGATGATLEALRHLPGAEVREIESGCCGMAGAFGYQAEHRDVSMAMGELELLPAVREAPARTRIVAAGTSCRAQIRDGTGRAAVHPAVALREGLG